MDFWKMANDPNTPEYVMEYTYAHVPPPYRWYGSTKLLNLPLIAHECGKCHVDLCGKHVVNTPTSHYCGWYTCKRCAKEIRKDLKLNQDGIWIK
jgi:hypothetical protein